MKQKRILIVDDNAETHKNFIEILYTKSESASPEKTKKIKKNKVQDYKIDSAYHNDEAVELVRNAVSNKEPYALAFINTKMSPNRDNIEIIRRILDADPNIQIVICTTNVDHFQESILDEFEGIDNLLILKKPFEIIEIGQLISELTKKWSLLAKLHAQMRSSTDSLEDSYSLFRATLESVREGILAVDLDGHILIYNNIFLKQWGISEDLLKSEKSSVIFEKLAERVENPIPFLKMMNELNEKPKIENIREWQLKTGRILELFTHPQYSHKKMKGIVYSFQDITERKELEKQLHKQATHDALTGLPNRALFLDRANQAITHAKRFKLYVAILQIDLDFFKEVNDALGHNIGDLVLQCIANKMSKFMHESDTIARSGSDEFSGILAAQINEEGFIEFLSKFTKLFSEPCQIRDREIVITASIGVSIYPKDAEDADTLLKKADIALYEAKKLGGNRFQFYSEEFNKQVSQRSEIRAALNQALQKNELSLCYQPLIELKTNKPIGAEALLRWNHPVMGNISPQLFIPIAEDSGLIISIGNWVLKTACKQIIIWQQLKDFSTLRVSVNISAKQFSEENFIPFVRSVLKETKLNPNCLELEITESLILANIDKTIQKMNELKEIGIRFAIDDFGTGYSTLSYLKLFQFDTVKIDKSFISNVITDINNTMIVEAIINMTSRMKISVLAEGVEREEQIEFLRKLNADQVQGFYYSEPLNVKAFTKFLEEH